MVAAVLRHEGYRLGRLDLLHYLTGSNELGRRVDVSGLVPMFCNTV